MVKLLQPNAYSTSGLTKGATLYQATVDNKHSVAVVLEPNGSTRSFCDCKNAWIRFGDPNYRCKHVVEVLQHTVKTLEVA